MLLFTARLPRSPVLPSKLRTQQSTAPLQCHSIYLRRPWPQIKHRDEHILDRHLSTPTPITPKPRTHLSLFGRTVLLYLLQRSLRIVLQRSIAPPRIPLFGTCTCTCNIIISSFRLGQILAFLFILLFFLVFIFCLILLFIFVFILRLSLVFILHLSLVPCHIFRVVVALVLLGGYLLGGYRVGGLGIRGFLDSLVWDSLFRNSFLSGDGTWTAKLGCDFCIF